MTTSGVLPDPLVLAGLAQIHALSFTALPRPWSAEEIRAVLQTKGSFLLSRPDAFLIGRIIADEAELLTLATAPSARRQGRARELLHEFSIAAARNGAITAYLEVASDNLAALALYRGDDWAESGLRRNYYAPGHDAAILTRRLTPQALG